MIILILLVCVAVAIAGVYAAWKYADDELVLVMGTFMAIAVPLVFAFAALEHAKVIAAKELVEKNGYIVSTVAIEAAKIYEAKQLLETQGYVIKKAE